MKKLSPQEEGFQRMEIEVIPGLEAIRRCPEFYLGNLERKELFEALVFEALCHAINEAINHHCKRIQIDIDSAGAVCIQYDVGIPLDLDYTGRPVADVLLTELLACHNLKKHIEVGSKYCQYGLAALNAVCSEFQVDTVCNGLCGQQIYHKGMATQDFNIAPSQDIEQTRFRFLFDEELLGCHEIDGDRLQVKAKELVQSFQSQLQIVLNGIVQNSWVGVPYEYQAEWQRIYQNSRESLDLSEACPVCGTVSLHHWYQVGKAIDKAINKIDGVEFVAKGGLWEWCSSCRSFAHYSCLVPSWWSCDLEVDVKKLTSLPTAIEDALQAIGEESFL
jgi:DNA gyrase/topoisomerase IV subunit B